MREQERERGGGIGGAGGGFKTRTHVRDVHPKLRSASMAWRLEKLRNLSHSTSKHSIVIRPNSRWPQRSSVYNTCPIYFFTCSILQHRQKPRRPLRESVSCPSISYPNNRLLHSLLNSNNYVSHKYSSTLPSILPLQPISRPVRPTATHHPVATVQHPTCDQSQRPNNFCFTID